MSEVLIISNINVVMINVGVHIYLFNVLGCVYIIYMIVVVLLHVVLIYNFIFAYACLQSTAAQYHRYLISSILRTNLQFWNFRNLTGLL